MPFCGNNSNKKMNKKGRERLPVLDFSYINNQQKNAGIMAKILI